MPIYVYRCAACGAEDEKLQRMDEPPPVCSKDEAHGPMVKRTAPSFFQLKGDGWAKDGYGRRTK